VTISVRAAGAAFAVFTLAAGTFACGSDSPTGPGAATISATIAGEAWSATAPHASAQHNVAQSGLTIFATDPTAMYGLAITLQQIDGPGTYTLHDEFPLRFAVVTLGAAPGWGTTYDGSGSVTIATLSSTRVTGTFQFTAGPQPGSTQTTTLTVSNGSFDLPVIEL
jgi:hypothetical protein